MHAQDPAGSGEQTLVFTGEGDCTREFGSEAEEKGPRGSKAWPTELEALRRVGEKGPGLKLTWEVSLRGKAWQWALGAPLGSRARGFAGGLGAAQPEACGLHGACSSSG